MARRNCKPLTSKQQRRRAIVGIILGCLVAFPLGVVGAFAVLYASALVISSQVQTRNKADLLRNSPGGAVARARDVLPPSVFEVTPPKSDPSRSDLRFGEKQVRQMVRDCPDMAVVKPSDPIWRYCVEGFAGRSIGERIYWDPIVPSITYVAEHSAGSASMPAHIRVRVNDTGNPETRPGELWSRAAYELENIRGRKAFAAAFREGLKGNLSRDEWLRAFTRPEYLAFHRTKEVYEQYWLPTAKLRGLPEGGESWGTTLPDTYEDWILRFRDPKGYPWNNYGASYDRNMSRVRELTLELRRLESRQSNRRGKRDDGQR